MPKTISNVSTEATEELNVTGELTPILRVQPEDGLALIFKNSVNRGDEAGIPLAANLEDSNGNDLPLDSDLALAYKQPGDTRETVVSETRDDIEPYRALSLAQQRKEDFIDATKIELNGARLVVRDIDELLVLLDSSAQIDYSNSRLSFNEKAVEEVSMSQIQGDE